MADGTHCKITHSGYGRYRYMTQYKGRGFLQTTGKHNSVLMSTGSNTAFGYTAMPSISLNSGSSNTINLGNITSTGFSAQSIAALNPLTFTFTDPNVTRYEILESKQDLLVLSAAWSRLRNTDSAKPTISVSNMLDDNLFSYVNQNDIDHANVIRDYYAKKFTVLALKNIELSPFRKDLKELVTTDGKRFKESMIPLAYRMPEFYEYDLEFETLLFENNRELKNYDGSVIRQQNLNLKLEKTFTVNGKKSKRKEYWFSDNDKNLVTYFVEQSNPLKGLFEKYVADGDISVSAVCRKRERDGYEYIKIHSVDFG